MNICIMTDLEGVACVMNAPDWIYPTSRYYEDGKRLLTEEVNAAADGFFAAGADRIVVQDGHGHGAINGLLLDERLELQRGWSKYPYPFGADKGFDCIAWVGQHPKSRTIGGHICHTGNFGVLEIAINGIAVGEFGESAFSALEYGVVPIFGSGCKAFTVEAEDLFPGIETVWVKEGIQEESGDECTEEQYEHWNAAAIHLSHKRACDKIRGGAYAALKRFTEHQETFSRKLPEAPYHFSMKLRPSADRPEVQTFEWEHPTSVTGLLNRRYER